MVEIKKWLEVFMQKLQNAFGDRIEFVGLQGSYARHEETESSDIDVVVIFDKLSVEDIVKYNILLDELQNRDLICGFISGKNELLNWEPSDLIQFYFDTKPIKGCLDELLYLLDNKAVARAIKIGACNIYHSCVHNMLHDKSEDIVKALYKSAVFTIQAIHYQQTGEYVGSRKELLKVVNQKNQEIIGISLGLKNGENIELEKMSEILFVWAKKCITE
jgi:predicted nucleotidyltransferase